MLKILISNDYSKEDVLEFSRKVVDNPEEIFKLHKEKANLDVKIGEILDELRIPLKLCGYHYLIRAVVIVYDYPKILEHSSLFGLYPIIAKEYNMKPSIVMDAIKEAVNYAWTEAAESAKRKYFKDKVEFKIIQSSTFIDLLAKNLK